MISTVSVRKKKETQVFVHDSSKLIQESMNRTSIYRDILNE